MSFGVGAVLLVVSLVVALEAPLWAAGAAVTRLELLGEATLPGGQELEGTVIGGLSGIAYAGGQRYYAVSDDPSQRGPARVYTLSIDLSDGTLDPGDVVVTGVIPYLGPRGRPLEELATDGEGIALLGDGSLFICSEGQVELGVAPFVRQFSADGSMLRELALPERFWPARDGRRGVRHNLAFESLTLTPDGASLFTATENALAQDGPVAELRQPSAARILEYDLAAGRPVMEYLYLAEPVAAEPVPAEGFRVSGLVELLALDDDLLLALERSYSQGVEMSIRLYQVFLAEAVDVRAVEPLEGSGVKPVEKELLLDLAELGVKLENLEGMTLGPILPDGRSTLLLVSDDNFDAENQRTQFLAFALDRRPVEVRAIQARAHSSPLAGSWVSGVVGVVTAVDVGGRDRGFWIQSQGGDGDDATSEGLLVSGAEGSAQVRVGDLVRLDGRVEEGGFPGKLTVTRLGSARVEVVSQGHPLPPPVVLGPEGRMAPTEWIDDDGLRSFDPGEDAVDFFESLEGMRIEVRDAVVVGPTGVFGELVVLAGGGEASPRRTRRGGLLQAAGDLNPERLVVVTRLVGEPPQVDVGDRFTGPLVGVLHYAFGTYLLAITDPLPAVEVAPWDREVTSLRAGGRRLTAATYNVHNLAATDPDSRFARLADSLVLNLESPDIVALQEIQDDSGPGDDGVVTAERTFAKLIAAVEAAGGPRYEYRQIDPLDGADGGAPAGNIRVGFLFDPRRVEFVDRGRGTAAATRVVVGEGGPRLSPSPGWVAPADPSFAGGGAHGFEGGRKALAGEFRFRGRRLFLVVCHLRSKRGDQRPFGAIQPPRYLSQAQRSRQAEAILGLVDEILAADPEARIVVLGDMNDHELSPPVQLLARSSLGNLVERVPVAERYTFVFEGSSQVLDHILVSPALAREDPEVDIVHLNADFAETRRVSDHDPVVARLGF